MADPTPIPELPRPRVRSDRGPQDVPAKETVVGVTRRRGWPLRGAECIHPVEEADYERELKELYGPRAGPPAIVDVPELSFLMVDGMGDPNTPETTGRPWRPFSPSPTG